MDGKVLHDKPRALRSQYSLYKPVCRHSGRIVGNSSTIP